MVKPKKITPKILIFDFDGTIVDTKALYYDAIYETIRKFGFKYKDVDKAIDMGETLRKMLKKIGFGFVSSLMLERRVMKHIKGKLKDVGKCKDVSVISKIKHDKIIVSNSSKYAIMPIVKHLELKKDFLGFYGAEDFDIDKASFITEYLKKGGIKKKECVYIGDRVADVGVASKVGCVSVIISGKCSWDSKKELINSRPDFLLGDLKDLVGILG